jgi:hypothetical protein
MSMSKSDDKRRRAPHDPQTGKPGNENEPNIPGDADNLSDDQADSGPDRDHKPVE